MTPRPGIPRCCLEPAVLLGAAYTALNRPAHGVLAASVQQRLTTPQVLLEWVDRMAPLRRAKPFERTLADIAGGAHSGAERDVSRMCRRFGLPQPRRQLTRVDSAGRRRWTDCEWQLPEGSTLVLEVDGTFHLEVRQWQDDLRRARRLTTRHRLVVRCTAYEVRHETAELAAELVALGLPQLPRGHVPDSAAWTVGSHTTR